jgi:hypothetical protein
MEVTTSGGYTVAQDFDYSTSTAKSVQDDYYPGITLTPTGNLAVTFAYSSQTTFPSMAITGRTPSDRANALEPPTTVAVGKDNEQGGRYGDFCDGSPSYSAASVAWLACEYILNYTNYVWNTHIESLAFSTAVKTVAVLPAGSAPKESRSIAFDSGTFWSALAIASVVLTVAGLTTTKIIHQRRSRLRS